MSRSPTSRILSMLCVVVVSVSACDNALVPSAPSPLRPDHATSRSNALIERDASVDGSFARLGAVVSSFSGAWLDSDGALVISMTSLADSSRLLEALLTERHAAYRASDKLPTNDSARPRAEWHRVKFERADFAFSDLLRWKTAMTPSLMSTEGVSSIDVDEQRNSITVGITHAVRSDAVLRILRDVGAPEGTLRLVVEVAAVEARQSANLSSRHRPLTGGYELGPSSCTITGAAYRGFEPLLVTSSHCTATAFSLDGLSISQGNTADPWGFEVTDPNRYACGTAFNWKSCRRADIAAYNVAGVTQLPVDTLAYQVGLIARTEYPVSGSTLTAGSLAINQATPYWFVEAEALSVLVGTGVHKVGRSTGWTYGTVTRTCKDRQSALSTWIVCSDDTNLFSQGGDSGSPVFIVNNSVSVTFVGSI